MTEHYAELSVEALDGYWLVLTPASDDGVESLPIDPNKDTIAVTIDNLSEDGVGGSQAA